MAAEVVSLLEATLNPKQHKQAEAALREKEKEPGFSLLLLQITASDTYPETTRLSSALCFKNLIRRSWTDADGNHLLPANEVATIKNELVGLMIATPNRIRAQLGDAISVIADSDFGERWDTLVDDLVSRLTPDNTVVNHGVLQVAHTIFRRWRPLYRSDALFTEINDVLNKFTNPFLLLLQNTNNAIDQNEQDAQSLQQLFGTLNVSFSLLYDLSIQDLPPAFEDNLEGLSALLQKYLTYDNALLEVADEAGPLENAKANIFELLTMWVQKYEDVFSPNVNGFVATSWNLLTRISTEVKNDLLASRALHFLTSVSAHKKYASNFDNDETLAQVVENVILPNVTLRPADIELFEDEPVEFTRRDLEGSDSETRRRATTDFLRQLLQQMRERVTATVLRYVDHYMNQYSQDEVNNWQSKDTAVYLFSSIAALGMVTSSHGVVSTNPHVNVIEFFQKHIAEDLISNRSHILLQVDAIKSQMTQQQWLDVFPQVVRHLASQNYVLHTYSAIVIDRALYLTDDKHEPYISRFTLEPIARDILQRLFRLIERDSAPEKVQENEFLMRCIMRVIISLGEAISPHCEMLLTNFISITRVIRHNPSNPRFYYFLFEAFGALIHFVGTTQSDRLEKALHTPFSEILNDDVPEFTAYIFQLFAALLESDPSGGLPEHYKSLVPAVLSPQLWDSKGNTPALVRLLQALVSRGAKEMAAANQIEPTLGVFQKLISSKTNDIYGFDLLETIVTSFPSSALQSYLPIVFNLLLTRLQHSKTESFENRFTRFYHLLSARVDQGLGTDVVVSVVEQIRNGLFAELYPPFVLKGTEKLSRPLDRKLAVISFTRTLADSEAFAQTYAKGWARTCENMLAIMVNPPKAPPTDLLIPDQDVDDVSFGVGFTPLNTCKKPPKDLYPEIVDLKSWISTTLQDANARHAGRVSQFIQERLAEDSQKALIAYMQS